MALPLAIKAEEPLETRVPSLGVVVEDEEEEEEDEDDAYSPSICEKFVGDSKCRGLVEDCARTWVYGPLWGERDAIPSAAGVEKDGREGGESGVTASRDTARLCKEDGGRASKETLPRPTMDPRLAGCAEPSELPPALAPATAGVLTGERRGRFPIPGPGAPALMEFLPCIELCKGSMSPDS